MLSTVVQPFTSVTDAKYCPGQRAVAVCVVCVPVAKVHKYPQGGPLPVTVATVAVPLQAPKQVTSIFVSVITGPVELLSPIVSILIHPCESITVSMNTPAQSPVAVADVCPLLQKKEYGLVPPEPTTVMLPLQNPQVASDTALDCVSSGGEVMMVVCTMEHPFASERVSVCVPAQSPVAVAVVCALLQRNVYATVPPTGAEEAVPSQVFVQEVCVFVIFA